LFRKSAAIGLRDVALGAGDDDVRLAWNPLFHFEKPFSRSYSTGEWEFRLRLMTRGKLPANYRQTYSLVIEVVDAHGGTNVRDAIIAEAGATYQPIALRAAA
jgi:hypothetical protein